MNENRPRLIIVGGGVIGLATAWRAHKAGWSVTVIDPHPMRGASWAAAGMLAPVTESTPAEPELLQLGLTSAAMWQQFAQELASDAGQPCGYLDMPTLVVGYDRDDRAEMQRLASQLDGYSIEHEWLLSSRLREIEPALASECAGGMLVPRDHSVDNRALLGALAAAADRLGITIIRERVSAVDSTSATCASGAVHVADAIIVAAGIDTPALIPQVHVRPVKGQIIRVLMTSTTGRLLQHTLRAVVRGRHVYLVPRSNGEIVIGATMEERGRDISVTVGAVADLLSDARTVLPGLDECELVETWAGLRPVSRDNLPIMEIVNGVVVATGHGRNGILLTPYASQQALALADQVLAAR